MANVFKKIFNKEKWEEFLYRNEDDYYDDEDTYDDIMDEYHGDRVPMYDMKESDIEYVDVQTGKPVDYIPVKSTTSCAKLSKYQCRERKLSAEQRRLLGEIQALIDYEFLMNGYITQEKIHEILGLDRRVQLEEEEEPAYVTE